MRRQPTRAVYHPRLVILRLAKKVLRQDGRRKVASVFVLCGELASYISAVTPEREACATAKRACVVLLLFDG